LLNDAIIALRGWFIMGLRIRRSIKLGKYMKVNVSKSGMSLSAGVKGARVNLNSKGVVRRTVGINGTGISYTDSHKIGGNSRSTATGIDSNVVQTAKVVSSKSSV